MGFDTGSITEQVAREMYIGLSSEDSSFADLVCSPSADTSTLNGSVPKLSSLATLAQNTNAGLTPGAQAKPKLGSMSTVSYNCLAYVGSHLITDEERHDMGVYGIDRFQQAVERSRADANLGVDLLLTSRLESTSLNQEFDVTSDGNGAWDDYTNSTPIQDILKAFETKCPEADTFIYGISTMRFLLGHPDIVAETSNFSGGSLDFSALDAYIQRKIPQLRNVYHTMKFYNNSAYGASPTFDHFFKSGAWMGKREDLVIVRPDMSNASIDRLLEMQRLVDRRSTLIQYVRYADIVRPTQDHGCYFSGIAT